MALVYALLAGGQLLLNGQQAQAQGEGAAIINAANRKVYEEDVDYERKVRKRVAGAFAPFLKYGQQAAPGLQAAARSELDLKKDKVAMQTQELAGEAFTPTLAKYGNNGQSQRLSEEIDVTQEDAAYSRKLRDVQLGLGITENLGRVDERSAAAVRDAYGNITRSELNRIDTQGKINQQFAASTARLGGMALGEYYKSRTPKPDNFPQSDETPWFSTEPFDY